MTYDRMRAAVLDKQLRIDVVKSMIAQKQSRLEALAEQYEAGVVAQQIVQQVAQEVQNVVHRRISGIVTRCLAAVFDDQAYEFRIDVDIKRGRTEARMLFVRDGVEVDPLTASGGGVVDVASFALRLAALCLSRPPRRKLLVLDEPFRFVSAGYRDKVRDLLLVLSEELEVQIIMVTHDVALRVGTVVHLE